MLSFVELVMPKIIVNALILTLVKMFIIWKLNLDN